MLRLLDHRAECQLLLAASPRPACRDDEARVAMWGDPAPPLRVLLFFRGMMWAGVALQGQPMGAGRRVGQEEPQGAGRSPEGRQQATRAPGRPGCGFLRCMAVKRKVQDKKHSAAKSYRPALLGISRGTLRAWLCRVANQPKFFAKSKDGGSPDVRPGVSTACQNA